MGKFRIMLRVVAACTFIGFCLSSSVLGAEDAVRFAVFSDSRSAGRPTANCAELNFGVGKVLERLVQSVLDLHKKRPIQVILFLGDMIRGVSPNCGTTVARSNRTQLQHWRSIMIPLTEAGMKIRVTAGNHEVTVAGPNVPAFKCSPHSWPYRPSLKNLRVFKDVLHDMLGSDTIPGSDLGFTYSFDEGNVHFVVLDAYTRYRRNAFSDEILGWLEDDLRKAGRSGKRLFVASHPPAFPGGGHMWDSLPFYDPLYKCDNRSGMDRRKERDRFWKILKRHHVIAYFCGHEHNIQVQRVRGVWHVVSGGVTPRLYPLNGSDEDRSRNTILYDGKFQNPEASVIWPWNGSRKAYWGWCLVTVRPESIEMEVFGTPVPPRRARDFESLKRFVLWERNESPKE
jgi:hypothetical protein